jgi:hypothetical protein
MKGRDSGDFEVAEVRVRGRGVEINAPFSLYSSTCLGPTKGQQNFPTVDRK